MQKQCKQYYRSQRTRNIFSNSDTKPYKLSRSRIEIFIRCPRCFYLDRKCGTERPPMYAYTLNNAVDALLKKEFDCYRLDGARHPLLIDNGIDAIPFSHPNLQKWRTNLKGIEYVHQATNLNIYGAIDDVWINPAGELIVVDYKATSSSKEVTLEDRDSYKRQMEIYQWLFRKNGFTVSNTGYFVYCNGETAQDAFSSILPFKISLLSYEGDDLWIENVLFAIKLCLRAEVLPEPMKECEYCSYWAAVNRHVQRLKA